MEMGFPYHSRTYIRALVLDRNKKSYA